MFYKNIYIKILIVIMIKNAVLKTLFTKGPVLHIYALIIRRTLPL